MPNTMSVGCWDVGEPRRRWLASALVRMSPRILKETTANVISNWHLKYFDWDLAYYLIESKRTCYSFCCNSRSAFFYIERSAIAEVTTSKSKSTKMMMSMMEAWTLKHWFLCRMCNTLSSADHICGRYDVWIIGKIYGSSTSMAKFVQSSMRANLL